MPEIADFVPASLRIYRSARRFRRDSPDEYAALLRLACPTKLAIDVGANRGVYTYHLRKHAEGVVAIEPNPRYARMLCSAFPDVKVIEGAASDADGTARLRIPHAKEFFGMATIEASNDLRQIEASELEVRTFTLDSLCLEEVGFIKIDVEGHELAVLHGAKALIARDLPNLFIEAESRHRPDALRSVDRFLEQFGYSAAILIGGQVSPIGLDSADETSFGTNNFMFVSTAEVDGEYFSTFRSSRRLSINET